MDAAPGRSPAVVDVHAHFMSPELPDLTARTGDSRWPLLRPLDRETGVIMRGDEVFRRVRSALWNSADRCRDLDDAGVDVQVLSPVPVTLTYWSDPHSALEYARAQNDLLAEAVALSSGRLLGLGSVPLQDVDLAIGEMTRAVTDLGLAGVEIGAHAAGKDLDDPALDAFFAAAVDVAAAIFIHPMDGGADVVRRSDQLSSFGIGMLTDTALAASALVFGGVLERHPGLRVGLAHGCGSFPWVYPRMRAAAAWGAGSGSYDELIRRLWVDTLVFDPLHLRVLHERFGPGRLMLGSDHPFLPGYPHAAIDVHRAAARHDHLTAQEADAALGANALSFLGIRPRSRHAR